jgi:hypothetical protein
MRMRGCPATTASVPSDLGRIGTQKTVPEETPAYEHIRDGRDDDLRSDSDVWENDPMRFYRNKMGHGE